MTSRHWADGPVGNTPISAAALNAMEADIAAAGYMGTIATGTDLNTLTAAGIYGVPTGTIYASLVNAPTGIMPSGAGWLDVRATSNGLYKQVFGFYGTTPVEVWRTTASVTAGTWNAWTRKDVGAINNPYVGVATNVRVMDFTERRGGTKYTNGLGAVAVRYDHGLVNMKATVYPLMVARGIPFSLAINSRTWGNAENNGTTAADVQSWVDAGWCEIWNHGADHSDQTTLAGLTDQIVTALSELKAQFPTVPIDGFIVPGVGGTNYNGFNGGGTPEAFYKTDAGRLILENHAVSTGSFPGTIQRVLDGKLRQGQSHYSMEAATVASITAQIDSAVTNKTGLQLFLHPSLLDTPGYMTTAMLTTVLDYIKTKRDAGLLAVMSPSDLLIASSEYAPAILGGKADKTSLPLSPKDYGAKGDGVADDTTALQNWITAGGAHLYDGTYRITSTLNIPGDNREFYMHNAVLKADTADMTMLTFSGTKVTIRATFDGNNKAAYGIKGTGSRATIINGIYENFYSSTNTARAIEVTTLGGVLIHNNQIRNVTSVGNGTIGDGPGFARGIALLGTADATARSVISDNIIENILGEEGDGIHILFYDNVANPFNKARVTIRGNVMLNVSRRYIKLQGSNVDVRSNELNYDLTTTPVNGTTAIDVIQSAYVTIQGNEVNPNLIGGCVAVNGTSTALLLGIVVRDNVFRQDDAKNSPHIYLNYATSPVVRGNDAYGGSNAVLVGSTTRVLVQGNVHYGGISTSRSFQVNASNTNAVVRENTNMNPARTDYLQNTGTGAYSVNNYTVPA